MNTLQDYISKGELLNPTNDGAFNNWINFTKRFLEENYGIEASWTFASTVTANVVPFGEVSEAQRVAERKGFIEKGLEFLRSFEDYPINENTIAKRKNRRDNTATNTAPIYNNMITIHISVDQALSAITQQAQALTKEKRSKVIEAVEQIRKFGAEFLGTAVGQVLKDKI